MAEITDPNALAQLNATGDDFLKGMDPARANLIKAIAEGRHAAPTGAAARSAYNQELLQDVYQYDPSADDVNLPARSRARIAFTSGPQGKNNISIATALEHSANLDDAITRLGNVDSPIPGTTHLVNSVRNAFRDADGNKDVTQFQNTVTPLIDELERAYTQTGGSVTAIKELRQGINLAQSTGQQREAVQTFSRLLAGKLEEQNKAYNLAMGTVGQTAPGVSDRAQQLLKAYGDPAYLTKGLAGLLPAHDANDVPPSGGDSSSPAATPPGTPPGPIDPSGQGDIGFVNGGAPKSPLSPEQQAAYDAFNKANPKATAEQLQAFGSSLGINLSNAADIVKARDAGSGVASGETAVYDTAQAGHPDAVGSFVANAVNAGTFGTLPKLGAGVSALASKIEGNPQAIGDIYGQDLAANNATLANSTNEHPIAALGGNVAGFIAGDAALGAIPGVAALAGRIPGAVRPLAGDALYGAAYGAGSSDNLADVPRAALGGAALGAAGGVLGRGIVRSAAAVASPVANAAVRRLTDAGVTLTPGQILGAGGGVVGRAVKGIEDRAAGFPIVGDVINNARRGGVEDFNRAAIDDALVPIGGKATDVGHAGIADARQQVSDAYSDAIGKMSATPDAQFTADLRAVGKKVDTLSQAHRDQFHSIVDTDLQPYLNGKSTLAGGDLQAIKQGLDTRISNLRGQGSSPQDRDLADRLADVRDSVLDLAGRSDPSAAADFQNANRAYSMLSRVEGAGAKAKDGVFTPQMFRTSVTKRGYGTTTANVAAGSAPMQQLATDASTILPSSVPDSGTAGRAALGILGARLAPGAALGGAAGYENGGSAGALTGAALGAAAFSRPGLRATQHVLAGSRGKTLNTLGDLLRANASLGGAVGAPLLLERRSR
jgi:hypothetical protein